MRLFTGLDLPPAVVASLEDLLARLRSAARIAWSPPANLHITTKFIGEWPEERLEPLKTVLAALPGRAPIAGRVRNLGFYPTPRSPRVFWCGVEADGLAELAADTEAATATLGIKPDQRAYSPHLTLARIRERLNLEPLHQRTAALPSVEFGAFEAGSFFLYRSQMRSGGSVYTKLAEFPLSK